MQHILHEIVVILYANARCINFVTTITVKYHSLVVWICQCNVVTYRVVYWNQNLLIYDHDHQWLWRHVCTVLCAVAILFYI